MWYKTAVPTQETAVGAGNRTWTCMKLLSHGPEPCASANSAIPAYLILLYKLVVS